VYCVLAVGVTIAFDPLKLPGFHVYEYAGVPPDAEADRFVEFPKQVVELGLAVNVKAVGSETLTTLDVEQPAPSKTNTV
jgi:hypothetical protein